MSQTKNPPLPADDPQAEGRTRERQLVEAIVKAQAAAKAAVHDAENTYHGFRYTSAESIIREAKQALCDHDLCLIPTSTSLTTLETGGVVFLVRGFRLSHANGGERSLQVVWPVVPDKGRPLDKALASATTTSLAYLLRDLLLLPRVDKADDLAARDDRSFTPPATPPNIGPKGGDRLRRIAEGKGLDLSRYLPEGKEPEDLSRDQANAVREELRRFPDLAPLPQPGTNGR